MRIKKSIRVVLIVFFSLIAVELILRAFAPLHFTGHIGAYKYDEELGVILKPDIHLLRTTDHQQEIITNKYGTVNFQDSFKGFEELIFAVGDSYTQGTGLPADASYPFQLDLLLNTRDGKYGGKYAVVNLGLAAFGARQVLLTLSRYVEILGKPAYIIYLASPNDCTDDILFEKGYRHKHFVDGNPYWGGFLSILQWVTNNIEIGKRLKYYVSRWRRSSHFKDFAAKEDGIENNKDKEGDISPGRQADKDYNSAQLLEPVLNELVAVSRDSKAELIIGWSGPGEDTSYQWLKRWAKDNNVSFADWQPELKSLRGKIPSLPIHNPHSGGHYRTYVNGIIARAFAGQIRP